MWFSQELNVYIPLTKISLMLRDNEILICRRKGQTRASETERVSAENWVGMRNAWCGYFSAFGGIRRNASAEERWGRGCSGVLKLEKNDHGDSLQSTTKNRLNGPLLIVLSPSWAHREVEEPSVYGTDGRASGHQRHPLLVLSFQGKAVVFPPCALLLCASSSPRRPTD